MENEEWRTVVVDGVIYDNYEVSNLGNVRSLNYRGHGKVQVLKFGLSHGYYTVGLTRNKERKVFGVHRLVAYAFINNDSPTTKTQINHKNFNRTDNRVENLEWITPQNNIKHAYDANKERGNEHRRKQSEAKKGEKHFRATKVLCVETGQIFNTQKEASEWCGARQSHIWSCLVGRSKTCKGYHWRYI